MSTTVLTKVGTKNAEQVVLLDAAGDQVTSFGGGTQYTEGDTDASITGTAFLWEDGSDTLRAVSAAKPLPVSVTGGGDATAANQTTGNASLSSIDTKTPALGQALAAASVPVVLTAAQVTTLTPPAAITGFATSAKQDTLLAELQLKADLTETQPVSLASVPSHAVTNAGTFATQAAQSGTWTVQPGNTANTTAWKVDGSAVTQPVSIATNTPLGNAAHDAADSGAPIKVGGKAINAEVTAVANLDRTDFVTDLTGKQIVLPYANPENFVSGAITSAMTGTTSTSLIAAPAAGLRNYITTIIVSNAHATVGTDVIIQDGSGGTTLLTIPAAAVYGGAAITLPTPLRQPTTATAIFCANVTTGASTKVSAVGYKGA